MHRLFFDRRGQPRLLVPGLLAFVVTLAVGFGASWLYGRVRMQETTPTDRAEALADHGHYGAAEGAYRELLLTVPSIELAIAFVENHETAVLASKIAEKPEFADPHLKTVEPVMAEDEVDALLEKTLRAEDLVPVRFWRGVVRRNVSDELRAAMVVDAARTPPLPFRNHLLAREDKNRGRFAEAAERFEREGLSFDDRSDDVDLALSLWTELGDWDTIRARLSDPHVNAIAGPEVKYRLAVHDRDWKSAARWLMLQSLPEPSVGPLVMTAVAALCWLFFCVRLGDFGERSRLRPLFYVLAFVLGVLSVAPTVAIIAVEEAALHLVETGDPARDILFFVFGVGLREEASKLLMFFPLLLVLRRWGTKGDVLVCGALVGLGFAAEENLSYLASGHGGSMTMVLDRFLTANFLHMAMTGILATALDDFLTDPERHASDFSRATLMVVGLHGAYDFFLSHAEFGEGFLAMVVFVFLAQLFLDTVSRVRRRIGEGLTVLHAFVMAVAIVTAIGFVYGTTLVGPAQAAVIMAGGLLGEAIIVLVFVRTLRSI